jgi:hypothetical protein
MTPDEKIWLAASVVLLLGILGTIVPVALAFLKKIKLDKPTSWFDKATVLGAQQQRLLDHEARIQGTLLFWKNKAAAHGRLHSSSVLWSLFSAVSLPVLVQLYEKSLMWSNVFLTTLTFWTGLVVALAHTFKSEELYRGFRQCESDYYDLTRRLLDYPAKTEQELDAQVDAYLETVYRIRALGRDVETNSPMSVLR